MWFRSGPRKSLLSPPGAGTKSFSESRGDSRRVVTQEAQLVTPILQSKPKSSPGRTALSNFPIF